MDSSKFTLVLLGIVFFFSLQASKVSAFTSGQLPEGHFEVSSQGELLLGDRINVTVRVTTTEGKIIPLDRKYKVGVIHEEVGRECETTDDTLKDDGVIKGYCENKEKVGNLEIVIKAQDQGSFLFEDRFYSSTINGRYIAVYKDPKEFCEGGVVAPRGITLVKQNDITLKVEWQPVEKFVGSYEVLYGTNLGEFPHKRKAPGQNSLIIDDLESQKEYYFKVQANSVCEWTASSDIFKYSPRSGASLLTNDKPKASPRVTQTPNIKSKSTVLPTPTPNSASGSPALRDSTIIPSPVAQLENSELEEPSFPIRIWNGITSFF